MAKTKKKEEINVTVPDISGIVTVIGTEASKFLKTGNEYQVSAKHAETLRKKGAAILKEN
jgi:hypothetical protein